MLTNIAMLDFKSWHNTGSIRLAPLTGFFGANSSGKSSLLHMLITLKATTESGDRNIYLETNIKDYIELGTLHDIVHNQSIGFSLLVEWDLINQLHIGEKTLPKLEFITTIGTYHDDKTTRVVEFTYRFEGDNQRELFSASMGRRNKKNYVEVKIDEAVIRFIDENMGQPIKCYGFSSEAINAFADLLHLNDLVFAFEQQFARVYHLGPIRDKTHRNYGWGGSKPSSVGIMGEDSIFALLASGDETIAKVGDWLNKMGLSASFNIKKAIGMTYQVEIKPIGSNKPVLLPDMGFGISQVLPVLVACYTVPEGSTLLIEQPEMHLHPSAQSVLADMFIEIIQQRKVQLIIESHSEHLLARLQRRMAEQKLDVNDTAFYFCRLDDGVSQIETLQLDKYGEIKNYPHDFFGDLAGDVIRRTLAGIEDEIESVK